MTKNLLKNTGIYFIVNLVSQAVVFVLWIIMAKILPASEIGIYVLAIFIVDFFGAFAIFGLNATITRFYYSEETSEEVFFNSFLIFIVASIMALLALFLSARFIILLIPGISTILSGNVYLFGLLIIASALYNFALSHYSALKKPEIYARISLLQTVLFSVFSLTFLYLGFGVLGILFSLFVSYLISGFVFLVKEIKGLSFKFFSIKTIKSLLYYGVPMMLYSTFGIIVIYIGRIFLDRYTSLEVLGIYGFFLMIAMQINAVWATFNRAWTPEIFSQLKENKDKALENIKQTTILSSFFYLSFMLALIVSEKFGILGLFLRQEYLSSIYIFYILLLGPLFNGIYTVCYPLYYYNKKTRVVMTISIFLNVINIFLTFLMVKNFGQIGAALSYFIFSIVTTFSFIIVFRKSMNIPIAIINWTLFLASLMVFDVFILLKTSSDFWFFVVLVLGTLLAYKMGKLGELKNSIKTWSK